MKIRRTERAHFRLIQTQCCHSLLCWVNPRLPNYCPECGKHIYPEIKGGVLISDDGASLKYVEDEAATASQFNAMWGKAS